MEREIMSRRNLDGALLQVEGDGKRTTDAYRACMKAFTESGHPTTVDGFVRYVEGMKGKRSASTVNQVIAAGRKAFMQAAEKLGLPARELAVIRGALAEVRRVKIAPPDVQVVTPSERAALFGALPLRMKLIAETLYVTGARISEILAVRRDQVKVNGHVELRLYGKGGKERLSKIPSALYGRIMATFPDGEYLFETHTGTQFHREYVSREIARAAKRVLGKAASAHTLRHSRATDLLKQTHRIKAVSQLLGHADESTSLRFYVRDSFSDEELFAGV